MYCSCNFKNQSRVFLKRVPYQRIKVGFSDKPAMTVWKFSVKCNSSLPQWEAWKNIYLICQWTPMSRQPRGQFCLSNGAPPPGSSYVFLASMDYMYMSTPQKGLPLKAVCRALPKTRLSQSIPNDSPCAGHPESCSTDWFKPLSSVPTGYSKGIYEKSRLKARGKHWVMRIALSEAGCGV